MIYIIPPSSQDKASGFPVMSQSTYIRDPSHYPMGSDALFKKGEQDEQGGSFTQTSGGASIFYSHDPKWQSRCLKWTLIVSYAWGGYSGLVIKFHRLGVDRVARAFSLIGPNFGQDKLAFSIHHASPFQDILSSTTDVHVRKGIVAPDVIFM